MVLKSQKVVEESVFAALCESVLQSPFEMENLRLFIQNKESQKLLREVGRMIVYLPVSPLSSANGFYTLFVTRFVMWTPFLFAMLVQQM